MKAQLIIIENNLQMKNRESDLGKPAGADLKLGLATAPVLFASEYNSDLKKLIERRFSLEGDVEKAFKAVHDSDGLEKTRSLARKHINEALKSIEPFKDCVEKQALIQIAEITLSRNK
ncbi:hypothetical protein RND71_044177 [Anisodus tanguticus]|uniref:Uncharacterized protein n=1 Tax=Anisodus tanguticus TaxID=243964 RepID=A0AAE1QRC1_9SOLA|nr:hypothetical protein RND71_044177 [Anisodus tanguticus]